MMIGQGMVGLCAGTHAADDDLALTEELFGAAAKTLRITEDRMDALTAVSGSGPAYFFRFCETMVASAEELGFTADEARLLVSQTASGAINYLCAQDGFPAGLLRQQVTSPGGTTQAALETMDAHDLAGIMSKALQAAEQRGKELAS